MSLVVIFPAGKETEADGYLDFCNLNNPDDTPEAIWDTPGKVDVYGQRVVGYLGPEGQWNGGDWPEPVGGEAARSDGVLNGNVVWPDEE